MARAGEPQFFEYVEWRIEREGQREVLQRSYSVKNRKEWCVWSHAGCDTTERHNMAFDWLRIYLITGDFIFVSSSSSLCSQSCSRRGSQKPLMSLINVRFRIYTIVAPKVFRPSSVYNVTATCFKVSEKVTLTLSIRTNNNTVLVEKQKALKNG